jgi:hypothetical protein
VQESTRVLGGLGANVVERIYPGMGHTINNDEITQVRVALAGVLQPASSAEPVQEQAQRHREREQRQRNREDQKRIVPDPIVWLPSKRFSALNSR